MNYKHFGLLLFVLIIFSCKTDRMHLTKIEGKQIGITDTLASDPEIEQFIKPYRDHLNKDLDSVIAYAVDTYSKNDGVFNTAIGNLFADVVFEQAGFVFNQRTGDSIDMVLLNHGGIRAIISRGAVTTRTAYNIMPFENSLVVVEMSGKIISDSLITYLKNAKRAHPIAGLQLALDEDYEVINATINEKPIQSDKMYNVVTNDYLYNGGDRMTFFQTNDSLHVLDYKVRNALLDYFYKVDTISPVIDDRFIQISKP